MICSGGFLSHAPDDSDELLICFTVPNEAKCLMEYLCTGQNSQPATPSFLSHEDFHDDSTFLEIIHQLVQVEGSSFAPDVVRNPRWTNSLPGLFWISGQFPIEVDTHLGCNKSPKLHIETNSFFCSPSRAEVYKNTMDLKKKGVPFNSFHEVQSTRKTWCRNAVEKGSKSYSSKSTSIPIVVVVLQASDFEYQSFGSSSLYLPLIIQERIKEAENQNKLDNVITKNEQRCRYRIQGFPEDVALVDTPEEKHWNERKLLETFFTDGKWKGDAEGDCTASDENGKIFFVSSAFILHSFFFRRACPVRDFLYNPAKESCIFKRDILDDILQLENDLCFPTREKGENLNECGEECCHWKNKGESCHPRKRRRDDDTATYSACVPFIGKGEHLPSNSVFSPRSEDMVYVQKKIHNLRSYSLFGEPVMHLLKCCAINATCTPADESPLLIGDETSENALLSHTRTREEIALESEVGASEWRLGSTWNSFEVVRCALEPVSFVAAQVMGTAIEDFFSPSSEDNPHPLSNFSSGKGTELVDLFAWKENDHIALKRNEKKGMTAPFPYFHRNKKNARHSPAMELLVHCGRKWATSFLAAYSFSKKDQELGREAISNSPLRDSLLLNKGGPRYRLLLLLEVLRRRQAELSYILHLFKSSFLPSVGSSCDEETREAYFTLLAFWDEVANEVTSMEVHQPRLLSSNSSGFSSSPLLSSTNGFTGQEAMLLYIQHFASSMPYKENPLKGSARWNVAQWKSHLAFLLLYGCDHVHSSTDIPQEAKSCSPFHVPSREKEQPCSRCFIPFTLSSFPFKGVQLSFGQDSLMSHPPSPELQSVLMLYRAVRACAFYISECMVAIRSVYVARWLRHAGTA